MSYDDNIYPELHNNDDDDYLDDDTLEIHAEVFDKDFDDVNFDGTIDDDSDESSAEMFDY